MRSYSINPCRNNECVRYFTVFARNHRSYPKLSPAAPSKVNNQRFPLRVRSSGESAELPGAECEGQCLPSGLGRMQRAAMSIP